MTDKAVVVLELPRQLQAHLEILHEQQDKEQVNVIGKKIFISTLNIYLLHTHSYITIPICTNTPLLYISPQYIQS